MKTYTERQDKYLRNFHTGKPRDSQQTKASLKAIEEGKARRKVDDLLLEKEFEKSMLIE